MPEEPHAGVPASYKATLDSGDECRRYAVQTAIDLIHAAVVARGASIGAELANLGLYADRIEDALRKRS